MLKKAHVDYIEFWTTSTSAAKAFYSQALGWTFTDYGDDYTALHDGHRESGGFHASETRFTPVPIFYADDLETIKAQVIAAGGTIGAEHTFPGGRRFHFTDPFGNAVAVWTKVAD
jgi:hypothetical protein